MKIWGIVGWKNTGKTGLTERLVAEFVARDIRVSTIKHAHHAMDIDKPGTDSHRHRLAGASEVLVAGQRRWAIIHENRHDAPPDLDTLMARLGPADLVLVEGYKSAQHPKIETYRQEIDEPPLANHDGCIRAVASDCGLVAQSGVGFELNDTGAIADFIAKELGL